MEAACALEASKALVLESLSASENPLSNTVSNSLTGQSSFHAAAGGPSVDYWNVCADSVRASHAWMQYEAVLQRSTDMPSKAENVSNSSEMPERHRQEQDAR